MSAGGGWGWRGLGPLRKLTSTQREVVGRRPGFHGACFGAWLGPKHAKPAVRGKWPLGPAAGTGPSWSGGDSFNAARHAHNRQAGMRRRRGRGDHIKVL